MSLRNREDSKAAFRVPTLVGFFHAPESPTKVGTLYAPPLTVLSQPILAGHAEIAEVAHATMRRGQWWESFGVERAVERSNPQHRLVDLPRTGVRLKQSCRHALLDIGIDEMKRGAQASELRLGGQELTERQRVSLHL